jgi:hypothetical protein
MIGSKTASKLRDTEEDSVDWPSHVTISHAVCAADSSGCGWAGFLLEGAFKRKLGEESSFETYLPAITNQICPNCAGTVFRTWRREFKGVSGL